MVHENGSNSTLSQEGVVNSASLEDVQLNEPIDNRAQSIQSLHSSVDTPTPDLTPSYDELQQRLEEYNRHIAQICEQKYHLHRIHSDAQKHLELLEQYQNECNERNLSFKNDKQRKNGESGDQPPDYESVEEVQNDMAILAQRVKNITRLVDNQKQLINQLPGDAGDEMRATQAELEKKLNELKRNGDDLRFMATELDTLNTNAEQEEQQRQQQQQQQLPKDTKTSTTDSTDGGMRVVPIRVATATAANQDIALKNIENKEAEIETMKMQLRRLKDMMGTIEAMETKTTRPLHSICPKNNEEQENDLIDRDRTPTPANSNNFNRERNLRILDNVSSDLRAESERNEVAQERIISLQDHIKRCSKQAAAAIQLGDDALKRHSATPTPTSSINRQRSISPEYQTQPTRELEREYHAKKKEFDEICRRLNSTDLNARESTSTTKTNRNENNDNLSTASMERNYSNSNINTELSSAITDYPTRRIDSVDKNLTTTAVVPPPQPPVSAVHDATSIDGIGNSVYNTFPIPAPATLNSGINWAATQPNYNYANLRNPLGPVPTFTLPSFVPQPPISLPFPAPPPAVPTALPTMGSNTNSWESSAMLQHCFQQQQIFGQALNQLHNIVWQQQREIEHLHRALLVLQERLIRLGGEPFAMSSDLGFDTNFRSESVPPTFNTVNFPPLNLANTDLNRAQSEQPITQQQQQHYMQQQQQQQHHHHHQQQRQVNLNSGGGIYSESQQQSSTASVGGSRMYSTLNNANVNGQNCRTQQPQDPTTTAGTTSHQETVGPAPIFMHHHNNPIHQNNSNLRRANISSGLDSNTLNNQVPPGNRTNNFWDNFRSYSRQNLFSTISNKSNLIDGCNDDIVSNEANNNVEVEYLNPRDPRNSALQPTMGHRCTQKRSERNKHLAQYQQQQQHNRRGTLNETVVGQRDRRCSSFNGATSNKNLDTQHDESRTRFKNFQQRQQQQQQQPNPLTTQMITNPLHTNSLLCDEVLFSSDFFSDPLEDELDDQITAEMYGANYEHPSTSHTRHERNVNFGNSPNNRQENKVPIKYQYHKGQYLSSLEANKPMRIDDFEEAQLRERQTCHRGAHTIAPRQTAATATTTTNSLNQRTFCNRASVEFVEISTRVPTELPTERECLHAVASISDNCTENTVNIEQIIPEQFERNLLENRGCDKNVNQTNRRVSTTETPCEKENQKSSTSNSNIKQRDVCKIHQTANNFTLNQSISRSSSTPNTRSENLIEDCIRESLSEASFTPLTTEKLSSYDTIGACSLAAQNHFQREIQFKNHMFLNDKLLLNQFSKLIKNIIQSLQMNMKNSDAIDNAALELIVKNTVQISNVALNNHEFPEGEEFLILLSHSSWLEKLKTEIIPSPFSVFLIWYEEYIKQILMNAAYKEHLRKNAKLIKANKTKESANQMERKISFETNVGQKNEKTLTTASIPIETIDKDDKTEKNETNIELSKIPEGNQAEVSLLTNKKNKKKSKKRKN